MSAELVVLEQLEAGVAVVRMRDAEARNALRAPFVEALESRLASASTDPEVRVIVLCGLPDVFCSGADAETLQALVAGATDPADLLLPRIVLETPVPVVAAMAGHAVGGGLALGVSADLCVAARESRYGCSFMNMGFTPGMGTTRLLEHTLSPALAHELLYTGELRRGSELEGRAFNVVCNRTDVEARARDIAARIAEKPAVAVRLLKRTLSLPRRRAFEEARALESLMHQLTFSQPDVRARIEDWIHG